MTTSAADLAERAGLKATTLSDLQRLAFRLGIGLLIAMALLAILIGAGVFFDWGLTPLPPLNLNATPEQFAAYEKLKDLRSQASAAQLARYSGYFQLLIQTVLLPAFTLVLGFLFGKQQQ